MADALTRRTKTQLARNEVPNPSFEGGMSHDMENMKGMDHSKMPGMNISKTPAAAPSSQPEGTDHSKMNMPAAASAASPTDRAAVEMEMEKTSGEMKKTSDELKKKSEAAKGGDKSAKSPPAPTIYTCVMHPEVQQPGPGKCPKCGMTLVKKEAAAP